MGAEKRALAAGPSTSPAVPSPAKVLTCPPATMRMRWLLVSPT